MSTIYGEGYVADMIAAKQCRSDGRCQYAIDHGAEGAGHCPKGKCCMPDHDASDEWREQQAEMRAEQGCVGDECDGCPECWVPELDQTEGAKQ